MLTASNEGPHRSCSLTPDEQKTQAGLLTTELSSFCLLISRCYKTHYTLNFHLQVTLWSIAKSPLMFGGDMRNLDNNTLHFLTEPALLHINTDSSNNKEVRYFFQNLFFFEERSSLCFVCLTFLNHMPKVCGDYWEADCS